MPERPAAFFFGMAKRMIDAKAPGLATMLKTLANINYFTEGWQSTFMYQLVCIYLVINGYNNRDSLPLLLQDDIRTHIGFTKSIDELKAQTGITDDWIILSKQLIEEDNLTTERNWLYGVDSRQYALILQFSFGGQGTTLSLTPGLVIHAELVFFPSVNPARAIIKHRSATGNVVRPGGFSYWLRVVDFEAANNMRFFKRKRYPVAD